MGALAIVLALASVPAQPSVAVIAFDPPAQVGPAVAVAGSQWLLLVFSNETAASGSMAFEGPLTGEEFLEVDLHPTYPGVAREPVYVPLTSRSGEVPGFDAAFEFGRGPASLYIEASNISWSVRDGWAGLDLWQNPACLQQAVGVETRHERSGRFDGMCPGPSVSLSSASTSGGSRSVSVTASGISTVELHNARLTCREAACPSGGNRDEQRHGLADATATRRVLSFSRLTGAGDGRLDLEGLAAVAIGGGSSVDVAVDGLARLPEASVNGARRNETLQLTGNFSLQGLTGGGDGSLTGRLGGRLASARLDEAPIDPSSLLGVGVLAAGAGLLGLALLVKVVAGVLFTKMRPERALLNKNRRAVYDYVQQLPGATLREIMRGTMLAGGTVRNHLRRLKESGHVIEQPSGVSRRFFPANHGREEQRSRTILLREPKLRQLWDMVSHHPWLSQGDCMDLAARELGWSRSTTQYRLGRLVRGGLVTVRQQGRFKLHAVAER